MTPHLHVQLGARGQVHLEARLATALPRAAVWERLLDFRDLVLNDPFHVRFHCDGPAQPGSPIRIVHGLWGAPLFERVGQIVHVEPGRVLVWSDLSARDRRRGFPHIYRYELRDEPVGTTLTLQVHGRWTATALPRPIIRAWLWGVLAAAHRRLRRALPPPASATRPTS